MTGDGEYRPPGWGEPPDPPDGGGGPEGPDRPDPEGCPVTPLGHRNGVYYFFSRVGEERDIRGRELQDRKGLVDLFAGDIRWLAARFRNDEGGLAAGVAGSWLIEQCTRVGIFNPDCLRRGPGIWRHRDRLAVHCGNVVIIDGERRRAGFVLDGIIYQLAEAVPEPGAPATEAEGGALLDALRLWQWEDPRAPDLMFGAAAVAMLGAAPFWRPHTFTRAAFGAGKTTQAELIAAMTGARPPAANVTAASLYQSLTGEARALVIDEAEAGEGDNRIGKAIEIIRIMSGKDGGRIGRGSAGGKAISYQVNGSAFLFGILAPPLRPADLSRFLMFKLLPLPTGPDSLDGQDKVTAAIDLAHALHAKLKGRAIRGWPRYLATVAVYRKAALLEGVEPRSADTLAAALAGRDLFLRSDIPGASEAEGEIARHDDLLLRSAERHDDGEAEQCLAHLLSSQVETWGGGERKTVGEKIEEAQLHGAHREGINDVLGRCGLKLMFSSPPQPALECLVVAHRHRGLDRIFDGTRWAHGVHAQALGDLAGAGRWGNMRFAGAQARGTAVPPEHLPAPEAAAAAGDGGDLNTDRVD